MTINSPLLSGNAQTHQSKHFLRSMRAMGVPKREVAISLALTIFSLMAFSDAFDSFWFVQQWPPAVCSFQKSGSCPGSGLRTFTIHGLWPQQSGTSLTNCPGSPFDITKVCVYLFRLTIEI